MQLLEFNTKPDANAGVEIGQRLVEH
jgi:hypothetical protein